MLGATNGEAGEFMALADCESPANAYFKVAGNVKTQFGYIPENRIKEAICTFVVVRAFKVKLGTAHDSIGFKLASGDLDTLLARNTQRTLVPFGCFKIGGLAGNYKLNVLLVPDAHLPGQPFQLRAIFVDTSLPLGWLGAIAHKLIVKNKLDQIFKFRATALNNYFGIIKIA